MLAPASAKVTAMASRGSPNTSQIIGNASSASTTPMSKPVRSSLPISRPMPTWLSDKPRTATASLCVPIASARYTSPGTKNASSGLTVSADSKRATMKVATMLPPSPTTSHGSRWRARRSGASSSAFRESADSRVMPARRCRSSTCSRRRMSINVVDATTPTRRPASSTTGRAATLWCSAIEAIFSWSVSAGTRGASGCMAPPKAVSSGRDEQFGRRQRTQQTPVVADHAHQFPLAPALLPELLAHRLCRVGRFRQHGIRARVRGGTLGGEVQVHATAIIIEGTACWVPGLCGR